MPRPSTPRLALLAALSAGLAACGGSSDADERKLIAKSRSEALLRSVDRVRSELDDGDCDGAARSVSRLRRQVGDLPGSYDGELVTNLSQWVDHLDGRVGDDCVEPEPTASPEPTDTPSPEPTDTPEPTETETPEPTSTPEPDPTQTSEPDDPAPVPGAPPSGAGGVGGLEDDG